MKNLFRLYAASFLLAASLLAASCSSTQEVVSVPTLSKEQKSYQQMPRAERIAFFADAGKRKEMKRWGYYPAKVEIALPAKSGTIVVRETPDTVHSAKSTKFGKITVEAPHYLLVSVRKQKLVLENLKIATRYDWTMGDRKGALRTEDMPPRLLKIKGVPNVRDLGGRIGLDGRRVRQGLVYRTAGLNDNASHKNVSLEELLKLDNGKPGKELASHIETVKKLETQLRAGAKPDAGTLPYTLGNQWTVFRPAKATVAELRQTASWKAIPAKFLGAKAKTVQQDANGFIVFSGKKAYRPAVFAQEFDAPADGVIRVGFGADWFLDIYVNGKPVYERLETGCSLWPIAVTNHHRDIPVRKGKNLIVAPMLSGNQSFTFCFGAYTQLHSQLAQEKAAIAKLTTNNPHVFTPGKNRLDAATKAYVVDDLGIRSDIDLRSDRECAGMTGSPAGDKVTWFHISSASYSGMQRDSGKKAFREVFKVFLKKENYPIVFHCIAGQDRTGAVAFIINGLLGVCEEQLYLDWESTGYWNPAPSFNHKTLFNHLVAGFDNFPGKTINERIEAYVLSLGFTKADIETLRSIMLEEK